MLWEEALIAMAHQQPDIIASFTYILGRAFSRCLFRLLNGGESGMGSSLSRLHTRRE